MLSKFKSENLGIINFFIFLIINIIFAQKIYLSNKIILFGLISLLHAFLVSIYFRQAEYSFKSTFIMSLIIFFNFLNIFLIKIFYKKINNFLIRKKIVKPIHLNKDFTHVSWDSDISGSSDNWDESRSLPPSGFDKFLSIIIIILPIIVTIPFYI